MIKNPFIHFKKILSSHLNDQNLKQLEILWRNPSRVYHNLNHLTQVLQSLELDPRFKELNVQDKQSLLLAAFFHDAIYIPTQLDNEDQSINLFKQMYPSKNSMSEGVVKLIEITKSHQRPTKKLEQLFWDADHSILKQNYLRLLQYEKQIRNEYSFVPEKEYVIKRIEILNKFIGIYNLNVDNNIKKLIKHIKNKYNISL